MDRNRIRLLILKYSKLLFDFITGNRCKTSLMVTTAAMREAYNQNIISNIALISRDYKKTGSLTNIKRKSALDALIRTHHVYYHPFEQYLVELRLSIT